MAYLYYTVTAVLLYLLSDWILNQIEKSMGKRLKYRSVIFFAIIMTLSLTSFDLIDRIVGDPPQKTTAQKDTVQKVTTEKDTAQKDTLKTD